MAEPEVIFECKGICKTFGGTKALIDVQLSVKKGEVHALLGENGAGKSTLMKCVIGLHRPDEGRMFFEGRPYAVRGPAEAIQAGISMIHQELNAEPHLSIAETIFLNREDTYGKIPLLNKKETNRRAQEILDSFNFNVKASTLMEELNLAQMQMIEIIRAVSCNARLIIMDEPTSSLDSEEAKRLFDTIRSLKSQGVSVIYISHRMEEIFEICDRVSVFRDGRYIDTGEIKDVSKDGLIAKMVGRTVTQAFPKVDCPIGDTVLKVEGLTGKGFTNINFQVHAGEILGFSGLVGSGRSETMRAIFGIEPPISGTIYLDGEVITVKDSRDAIEKGICMVNEDRKNFGLCLGRSLRENISLPNLPKNQKKIIINKRKEVRETGEVAKTLAVKTASLESEAYSLSGGNQQKAVLAKWVMARPKVLILDEPTRGVDVGAKSEIHSLMCKFAAEGLAIIMVSSELPEVMGMSDRIVIYHEGKINGIVRREDILSGKETEETILAKEFGQ
ncbi:MAG: sugar ABC transporter ATP-binding protein [Spirochaetaceae bacterium]|jgi:ribose transport system ATP-binding protein/inositol transport system ATP-binding protein|nr:sugar ABC transporter ATP-binding protein [Spirochaetaceae bacterium]